MKVKFIVTILRTEAEVFVNQQIDTNVELLVAVAPHQSWEEVRGEVTHFAMHCGGHLVIGHQSPLEMGHSTF